jgi:hypothetical protein
MPSVIPTRARTAKYSKNVTGAKLSSGASMLASKIAMTPFVSGPGSDPLEELEPLPEVARGHVDLRALEDRLEEAGPQPHGIDGPLALAHDALPEAALLGRLLRVHHALEDRLEALGDAGEGAVHPPHVGGDLPGAARPSGGPRRAAGWAIRPCRAWPRR